MNKSVKRRNDIILALILLLLAGGWMLYARINRRSDVKSRVLVKVSGEIIKEFPLYEDISYDINLPDNGHNRMIIENGYVRMIEADCPDKICVSHSAIHYDGEKIVCLPHALVVEIESDEKSEVDIIAE